MDRNLPDRRITVAGRAFQAGSVKVGRPRGCPGESQGVEWGEAGPKSAGKGAANSKRRSGEVGRSQIVRSPDLAGREWGLYSVGAEGEAGSFYPTELQKDPARMREDVGRETLLPHLASRASAHSLCSEKGVPGPGLVTCMLPGNSVCGGAGLFLVASGCCSCQTSLPTVCRSSWELPSSVR